MQESKGNLIGGRWSAGSGAAFEASDPATGEVYWSGHESSAEEVAQAVDAALAPLPAWAGLSQEQRRAVLERYREAFDLRKPEATAVKELVSGDVGFIIANIKEVRHARVGDTIEVGKDEGLFLTLHGYGHYVDTDNQANADTNPTKQPNPTANKQAWIDHAATHDIDTTDLTKKQIIEAVEAAVRVGVDPA